MTTVRELRETIAELENQPCDARSEANGWRADSRYCLLRLFKLSTAFAKVLDDVEDGAITAEKLERAKDALYRWGE